MRIEEKIECLSLMKVRDKAGAILWANPNTASFTAYMENLFSDDEQFELVKFVDEIYKKAQKR